jgi:carbon storage regulator
MLVLSRKEGERLVIGDKIVVTVVALDGGRVKLGIDAPPQIGIEREEILDRWRADSLAPCA